jgi:hypothetical protein
VRTRQAFRRGSRGTRTPCSCIGEYRQSPHGLRRTGGRASLLPVKNGQDRANLGPPPRSNQRIHLRTVYFWITVRNVVMSGGRWHFSSPPTWGNREAPDRLPGGDCPVPGATASWPTSGDFRHGIDRDSEHPYTRQGCPIVVQDRPPIRCVQYL